MRLPQQLIIPALLVLLCSCGTRYSDLPTFSAERKLLQLVVETPAGTNREQRYNPATNSFEPRRLAGLTTVVEFLPAPGNLGFVPGTSSPDATQNQPDLPLPALLLAESQPIGTVLEVLPIALLTLELDGTLRPIVVTVPARPSQRILTQATDWAGLQRAYPGVRPFLDLWFRNRASNTRIVGWKDEKAASRLIRQWMK